MEASKSGTMLNIVVRRWLTADDVEPLALVDGGGSDPEGSMLRLRTSRRPVDRGRILNE